MSHPVDLGGPALPQRLVELLAELLERILVRLAQRQGVLGEGEGEGEGARVKENVQGSYVMEEERRMREGMRPQQVKVKGEQTVWKDKTLCHFILTTKMAK